MVSFHPHIFIFAIFPLVLSASAWWAFKTSRNSIALLHTLNTSHDSKWIHALPSSTGAAAYYIETGDAIYVRASGALLRLNNIDAKSIVVSVIEPVYAKHVNSVYFFGRRIPGADPATFSPFATTSAVWYSYDRHNVYCAVGSSPSVLVRGSDPASFEVIFSLNYYEAKQQPPLIVQLMLTMSVNIVTCWHRHYQSLSGYHSIEQEDLPDTQKTRIMFLHRVRYVGTFTVLSGYWSADDHFDHGPNLGFDGKTCFSGSASTSTVK